MVKLIQSWKEAFTPPFWYDPESWKIMDKNGNNVLDLRGWGELTGTGGLNQPPENAAKIQDQFGEYVVSVLNKDSENK